ncbi:hypothetical protein PMIN01_12278 [Paraphaeosphaeria minitans]|uniref:Uncharacterized protein n=1 Tax=Paraphaeosphaeria minitans TaxID=565426 RepID=A0A9P6KKF6_9PLEO|nr:hypothetical protein PMIN01_12278 [Paraphaeosphaeria minitans]
MFELVVSVSWTLTLDVSILRGAPKSQAKPSSGTSPCSFSDATTIALSRTAQANMRLGLGNAGIKHRCCIPQMPSSHSTPFQLPSNSSLHSHSFSAEGFT